MNVLTVPHWQEADPCTVLFREEGWCRGALGEKEAYLDPVMLGVFSKYLSCPKHGGEICRNMRNYKDVYHRGLGRTSTERQCT